MGRVSDIHDWSGVKVKIAKRYLFYERSTATLFPKTKKNQVVKEPLGRYKPMAFVSTASLGLRSCHVFGLSWTSLSWKALEFMVCIGNLTK